MPESIKKNFFQPISSWMFDNDMRIIEIMDNIFLLAIIYLLLSTSAFFIRIIALKIIYLFHGLSLYLVFYLGTVVVVILKEVVVAEMVEEVANNHLR